MARGLVVVMGAAVALTMTAGVQAQTCTAPTTPTAACGAGDPCAAISVPVVNGSRGATVQIPITFSQGPNDSQNGRGYDEVSAVVFTLGVPGSGDAAPLLFDCADGNLAQDAVSGVPDNFTAVIENAQCAGRTHCLCPDTGGGQTRDNYVNVAVYGPRNLPEQGPVQIPLLPNSGTLLSLRMRVADTAPASIPLHIFSALDASKPQYSANLSIGDQAACDVTATGARSNVRFTDGMVMVSGATPPPAGCVGDCNADGSVVINELVIGVNIALGNAPVSNCPSFDANSDGEVRVNELISGVNNALNGCPATN